METIYFFVLIAIIAVDSLIIISKNKRFNSMQNRLGAELDRIETKLEVISKIKNLDIRNLDLRLLEKLSTEELKIFQSDLEIFFRQQFYLSPNKEKGLKSLGEYTFCCLKEDGNAQQELLREILKKVTVEIEPRLLAGLIYSINSNSFGISCDNHRLLAARDYIKECIEYEDLVKKAVNRWLKVPFKFF